MPAHSISFRSGRSGPFHILKIAAVILAALVALVLLAAAALAAAGGKWLRGPVERAALEKTGRVLKIEGDLKLGLGWPLLLRVHAENVSFANADWAKQPADMFTAGVADFSLDLPRFLAGRTVIDDLRLSDADLALEKDAQGRKNWELPGAKSETRIGRVAIDNSRIDYSEPARNIDVHIDVSSDADGLAATAKGRYVGQPVNARASGGPLLAVDDAATPYPFRIEATIGPTHASAKGTVAGLRNVTTIDAQASVNGGSLDQLFPLLGVALPDTPAYRTAGRVAHEGGVWRYEKFSTHIGESDVAGTLEVDATGTRPALRGEVVFGLLDLADLGATIGTDKTRSRVLPDKPFNAARWNSLDADLRISAQKIVRPHGVPIERFATRLRLRDAALTLDPLEFGIAGGKLSGTVKLDGRAEPIRAEAKLKIDKVALDRLVPGFDTSKVDTGRIDGAVDLSGRGDSVARMLGSSKGSVAMLVNGGHVSRLLMEEIGLHLPRIAALKAGGDQRVAIRCAAADFKVDAGVMHTQTGVFDTTVTRIDFGGDINLRDETLDITLNPNTKETSLLSLHTPIHVRGSFAKPDVQLEKGRLAAKAAGAAALAAANPLLALIPLMESGPGQDSDCGHLLKDSQAAKDVKKAPERKAAPK